MENLSNIENNKQNSMSLSKSLSKSLTKSLTKEEMKELTEIMWAGRTPKTDTMTTPNTNSNTDSNTDSKLETAEGPKNGYTFTPEAKAARDTIALSNQGLITMVIKNEVNDMGKLDKEDLISYGNIGLMNAIDRFDPSKGSAFSTFAVYWIRQRIFRGIYEGRIYDFFAKQSIENARAIEDLSLEKARLEIENEELGNKVKLLSETLNSKVQAENALNAEREQMHIPSEFPLTGSAQAKETDTITAIADMLFEATGAVIQHPGQAQAIGDPIVVFTAEEGSTVVASGSGTVILVDEDVNYGNQVVIDHGNGYISYYLNEGTPKVKEEDEVTQGDLIYVIGSENTTLGYQIKQDDAYINPMDLISISG